jgi:hypothetical protein
MRDSRDREDVEKQLDAALEKAVAEHKAARDNARNP